MHLTVEAVRKIVATERKEIPDDHCPGLYLLTLPSGVKSWVVRYRHAGRPRKLSLGIYREQTLGLIEARRLARDAIQRVHEGRDPAAEKIEARRSAAVEADRLKRGEVVKPSDSFAVVWEAFDADHIAPTLRGGTASKWRGIARRVLLPRWGKRPLAEITSADVYGMLKALQKTPDAADSALSLCKVFFGWCVAAPRHLIAPTASPVLGIAKVKRPKEKANAESDRALNDDEIRWLWKACDKVNPVFAGAVRLMLLTGARRSEVAEMPKAELNVAEAQWNLAAARSKNGRAHMVHLSAEALDVLKATPEMHRSKFRFSADSKRAISAFSKHKARLDKAMADVAAAERGAPVTIPAWRLHGLRKSFRTGVTRLGVAPHVAKKCINHSLGKLDETYDKGDYLPERAAAFDLWGRHVASVIQGPAASNVVPLRRA